MASFELDVDNISPIVTLNGDTTLSEGMTFHGDGYFTDSGEDTWTATVDYGDGVGPEQYHPNWLLFNYSRRLVDLL